MAFTAGVANVLVAPSFSGWQKAVGAQVNAVMPAAGRDAGAMFAAAMAQSLAAGAGPIKAAAAAATYGATAAATSAGAKAGAGFVSGMASGMRAGMAGTSAATTKMFAPATAIAAAAGTSAGTAFIGGAQRAMIAGTGTFAAAGTMAAIGPAAAITAAGSPAGTGFMTRAATGISRGAAAVTGAAAGIGTRLTTSMTAAGAVAGAGFMGGMVRAMAPLAAILAPAAIIGGGFSRLANIEDAQAKLTGLGHTAETVDEIMSNALGAVSGTAFGLDEAASVAAGLVAANIAPGEQLEKTLALVGDSATIAGIGLGEMGAIWNKVASSDLVQGDILNQMADRGIPIVQLLATELGVTAGEVRKLASDGKIGFAEFSAAMETGMAGAALESGNTTRGTLRNVGAAASRLGATIMEEIFPKIREWGALAIDVIDNQVIPAFDRSVEWAKDNQNWLVPITAGIGAMAAALTVAKVATFGWSGAMKVLNTVMNMNPILRVVTLILGLGAALVSAYKHSETFRNIVDAVWNGIKAVAGTVVDWFTGTALPFLQGVWDGISSGASAAWDWISSAFQSGKDVVDGVVGWFQSTLVPIFETVWSALTVGFEAVWSAITTAFEAVGSAVDWVWTAVLKPVFDAIAAAAEWLWSIVGPPLEAIGSVFAAIGEWIYDVVYNVILLAWDVLVYGIKALWENVLKPVWDAIAFAADWLWNNALKVVFGWITSGWDGLVAGIAWAWENLLKPAWGAVEFAAKWLWDKALKPVFRWIKGGWDGLVSGIKWAWENLLKPAWDAVTAAAKWLWDYGLKPQFDAIKAGWDALVDGITWVWENALKPALSAIGGFVEDTVVPGFQRGVEMLDSAWRGLANLFRVPINWVIDFVWNDGLKAAFDSVAQAVNSDARLPAAPLIPAFAKGGLARPGWALVGEEGPELVNFSAPGRVYTAGETRQMLGSGSNPMGFSAANPPHGAGGVGGWLGDRWDDVKSGAQWIGERVVDAAGNVMSWVRGGLANVADTLLSPLFNAVSSTVGQWGPMGGLGGDAMVNAKDQLMSWIRGKDDEAVGTTASDAGGRSLRGALPHVNNAAFAVADAVGGVRQMQAFNQSMHWTHRSGRAVDFIDSASKLQRIADFLVSSRINDVGEVIYNWRRWTPAQGWHPLSGGYGNDPGHTWHVHGTWPASYDQGGYLMPGQTGMNHSRTPEPVLTPGQWSDISTLAAQGATGSTILYIKDVNDDLVGRMRVEADGRISESKRLERTWKP